MHASLQFPGYAPSVTGVRDAGTLPHVPLASHLLLAGFSVCL